MQKKPYHPGPRPANTAGANANANNNRAPKGRVERNTKDPNNINENIRAREVRLVGDNVTQGIYPIQEARRIADEL